MTDASSPLSYEMRYGFGATRLPSGIFLEPLPMPTRRCRWCGRFRRDGQRPRHVCPAARRRRRVLREVRRLVGPSR